MKTRFARILGLVSIFAIASENAARADVKYPVRYGGALQDSPHKWTGLIDAGDTSGSGFVIRGANVVVTAAHVLWNRSARSWRPPPTWYRKYDSAEFPSSGGLSMRGAIVNTAYASVVNNDSRAQAANSFDQDYSVCYSYTQTAGGGYGGYYNDSSNILADSNALKLITGYPSAYTNDKYYYATGYFGTFTASFGKYYKSLNETAPNLGGNSGGPIWAESQSSPGSWSAAGIVVSGTLDTTGSVGVRALDSNVLDYIDQAQSRAITTATSPEIDVKQGISLTDGTGILDFGSNTVGYAGTTTKYFNIQNGGSADLTGIAITIDGGHASDFSIDTSGTSTSLASGASTSFSVTFAPQAGGSRNAFLRIASNDSDESPFDIAVTGMGRAASIPEIDVEHSNSLIDGQSIVDFGSDTVRTNEQTITYYFFIRNSGSADLTGIAINIDGGHAADFSIDTSGAVTSLAPGASTTFSVTFNPQAEGIRSAYLQIASNDSDESPFDIALTGLGKPATPSGPDPGPGAGIDVFGSLPQIVGRASYKMSGRSAFINVDRIVNSGDAATGTLRLRLYATKGSRTYVVATRQLGELPAGGHSYAAIKGRVAFKKPPRGNYFMTLTLEEYTDAGYVIVNSVPFYSKLKVR